MAQRKIRITPLDLIVAVALLAGGAYVAYRITIGLHYKWYWSAIHEEGALCTTASTNVLHRSKNVFRNVRSIINSTGVVNTIFDLNAGLLHEVLYNSG